MRTLLAIAVLVGWTAVARADVSPPDVVACEALAKGANCTLKGASGTCQDSTCTWTCHGTGCPRDDAGLSVDTWTCLKCLDASGNDPTGVDAGANHTGGGCSEIAESSTARELCALAIAGSFSLLFLLRRRRAR